MDPAYRHVALCNNARLPGGRTKLHVAGEHVGYVAPELAGLLQGLGAYLEDGDLNLAPGQLQPVARALADAGRITWRDEPFDVWGEAGARLGEVDRGALPLLGIAATGVHLNALVLQDGVPRLWVARRSARKLLEPGKLDHLVAGGVPAGLTPLQALHKEAEEEAGLPPALLAGAVGTGVVDYAMARGDELRRDRLHCFEVVLPADFRPEPRDGEVESFALWELADVLDSLRRTEAFKFNVPLVLLPMLERWGVLDPGARS